MFKTLISAFVLFAMTVSANALTLKAYELEEMPFIEFVGIIDKGSAEKLDKFLTQHPNIKNLKMSSLGGLAREGLLMADIISNHEMDVYVIERDNCWSSCAFAFLGGKNHYITGTLAFHKPYYPPRVLETANRHDLNQQSMTLGSWLTTVIFAHGFHVELAMVIMTLTDRKTYITFNNQQDFYRYYVGKELGTDTPIRNFYDDRGITQEWINRHLLTSRPHLTVR